MPITPLESIARSFIPSPATTHFQVPASSLPRLEEALGQITLAEISAGKRSRIPEMKDCYRRIKSRAPGIIRFNGKLPHNGVERVVTTMLQGVKVVNRLETEGILTLGRAQSCEKGRPYGVHYIENTEREERIATLRAAISLLDNQCGTITVPKELMGGGTAKYCLPKAFMPADHLSRDLGLDDDFGNAPMQKGENVGVSDDSLTVNVYRSITRSIGVTFGIVLPFDWKGLCGEWSIQPLPSVRVKMAVFFKNDRFSHFDEGVSLLQGGLEEFFSTKISHKALTVKGEPVSISLKSRSVVRSSQPSDFIFDAQGMMRGTLNMSVD